MKLELTHWYDVHETEEDLIYNPQSAEQKIRILIKITFVKYIYHCILHLQSQIKSNDSKTQ